MKRDLLMKEWSIIFIFSAADQQDGQQDDKKKEMTAFTFNA